MKQYTFISGGGVNKHSTNNETDIIFFSEKATDTYLHAHTLFEEG